MAYADPAPAFRSYQDEVWELMHGGQPLGGIEAAIEQTEVSDDHKVALWLLAFALSDPEQPYGPPTPDQAPQSGVFERHLSVVR
jgi:hypothetical protein